MKKPNHILDAVVHGVTCFHTVVRKHRRHLARKNHMPSPFRHPYPSRQKSVASSRHPRNRGSEAPNPIHFLVASGSLELLARNRKTQSWYSCIIKVRSPWKHSCRPLMRTPKSSVVMHPIGRKELCHVANVRGTNRGRRVRALTARACASHRATC
jgi:hypothetical protein